MPLNSNACVTVADLRDYLARERTAETSGRLSDADLTELINMMSSAIENHVCRRLFVPSSDETLYLDGDGRAEIRMYELGQYPIVSITSITNLVSNETIPVRPSVSGVGYVLPLVDKLAGIIRLDGYTTDVGVETVKVIGKWGFSTSVAGTTTPGTTPEALAHRRGLDALKRACKEWASLIFQAPIPSGTAVTVETASFTVREEPMPGRVKDILKGLVWRGGL